jgi:putative membrane protein
MHQHDEIVQIWQMWNPIGLFITFSIAALYIALILGAKRLGNKEYRVTGRQRFFFSVSLLLIMVSLASPLHVIGHSYLFSVHMLVQALLYLMMPPLMILSIPAWAWKLALDRYGLKKAYYLTHPLFAVLLFNVLFSFYHIPLIFDFVFEYPLLSSFYHFVLTVSAFLMWWPIMCPLEEYSRLSHLQKLGYVFANGVLITPACALIIFADHQLYQSYIDAPRLLSFLAPLDDQQAGGVIMKLTQEIIYGGILAYIFYQWFNKENNADDLPTIPQQDDKATDAHGTPRWGHL